MIYTISRIASFGSQNPEARSLSIDIIEVIFNWEKKTTEAMADGDRMDVDNDNGAGTQQPWLVPLVYRESIVSYLVRLAVTALGDTSANTRPVFAPKALAMVRQLLGPTGWKDVTVKLNYYSRNLEQVCVPEQTLANILTIVQADLTDAAALHQALGAARVLHGVCADQPDEWYREQGMTLQRLIRKGLLTDAPHLASTLMPIFERLIKLYPIRQEEEDVSSLAEFHDYVRTVLSDAVAISTTSLRPMIYMLAALARADAESVAPFSTTVLRLFQRLAKEYNDAAPENEALIQLFIPLMETIRLSIDYMGDQKKQLWTAVMWVPDKCRNLAMCGYLLQFARAIVLERQESYPTQKEKALLLGKLYAWDRLSQEKTPGHPNHAVLERQREFAGLFTQYLDLIYSIYAEPTLRRSDLTARLEAPFLVGCRARDLSLREKFITLLDANIPRSLFSRLSYIIGSQNWEPLQDVNWIFLASYLLLGSVNGEALISPNVDDLMTGSSPLITTSRRSQDLVDPLRRMLVLDPTLGHEVWVSLFPAVWTGLLRREQVDLTHYMITLLSKDYHHTQAGVRPNVIQSLLEGISACVPAMILPPHLVKYLAKNYGAWHVSIDILVGALDYVMDDPSTRDIVYDALAELYAELAEEDAFYGLWRRRAVHPVTSVAIALEEMGMWEQASATYEQVLIKARSGASSYTEPEYCLWEDHWVLAQEKLQQWDILYDLGRTEGNYELMLEAAWRTKNWSETRESMEELVSHLPETLTPRRAVFSGLLCHLKPSSPEQLAELERHHLDCDRLTLHKWISLPARLSRAHVPLLQHWQQSLELTEAKTIFGVLAQTSAQNLEKKSQELKMTLQAWRERLPGPADDISIWSDLVGWRRNIFNAINFVYQPLIQQLAQGGGNANGNAGTQNTLGYRGYHETAWIINRFAHVARKHDLLDVCHSQLVSIYTLPNIEISEAFLKLREQARCHYLKPDELASGLEVVNNTNLMYFTSAQKAEFFTLKGMFFAKMGRVEDANNAFGQAVQTDMVQAKAWAQWGKFNDRLFKEHKSELNYGANAVSCYLQAAGLYKSGKSRPLLARVLWLLSVDDASLTISRQFDQYKGEAAFWYWITFIPQLCLSISHREVKQARYILLNLARLFPQVGTL
jgi:transformation/transcription domain-associated protein